MRFILFLLLVVFSVTTNAQNTQRLGAANTLVYTPGMFSADSVLAIPMVDTQDIKTAFPNGRLEGRMTFFEGALWIYQSGGFKAVTSGGMDTSSLSDRINQKLDLSDTASMLSKYTRVQRFLDSIEAVKLSISSAVKYGDTAAMLANYTRVQRFLDSISAVRNLANNKQNQLSGTGFVKASGTTISYDNSTYTPTGRTITINGIGYDLSANRTWTIPGTDTTELRADIEALKDSTENLRTDVNGKEPAITSGTTADYWRGDKTWQQFPYIPDTSDFIKKSDTGSLVATPYQIDTATSRIWQMKVDNMWVSSDTFYWQRGQDVFFIIGMVGGGLDTTAGDARYWKRGGNAASSTLVGGTTTNQSVRIIANNSPQIEAASGGVITFGGASQFSLTAASNRIIHNAVTRHEWRVNNQSSFQMSFSSNGLGVGLPNNTSSSAALQVIGTSSTTGAIAIFENSAGDDAVIIRSDLGVEVKALSGTGTGVVTADDDGVLSIQRPPASGTYTLKSVDGVIQWVED